MQSIHKELAAEKIDVYAISADSVSDLKSKAIPMGFSFPLLADPDLKVIDPLGLRHEKGNPLSGTDIARPALMLIDENAQILMCELTDNWRVRPTPDAILSLVKGKTSP